MGEYLFYVDPHASSLMLPGSKPGALKPASELLIQSAFIKQVRELAPSALAVAIPNGGKRRAGAARQVKAEGLKKGMVDVVVTWPRTAMTDGIAFVEFKMRGGNPDDDQIVLCNKLVKQGHPVAIFRHFETAMAWLYQLGCPVLAEPKLAPSMSFRP